MKKPKMITEFKLFENNSPVDPYGEEDWNDDELKKEIWLSRELRCCGDDPMIVKFPETLICQTCGRSYMNLVTGVEHPYKGHRKGYEK